MKWKPFLLSLAFIAFLWTTFLSPWTQPLWTAVDHALFKALNSTLHENKFLQYFWGLVNHKRMDLVEDVIFLLFFLWGIRTTPKHLQRKKMAQFLSIILLAGAVIFFINRTLLRDHVLLPRESPSLVITPCVRLTDEIPWQDIKIETIASFPGDHATTLLLFGLLYAAFVPRRLALTAWAYVLFRVTPRLVVGAHWFSDIAVGSMTIALFFAACFLYTPFGTLIINTMEKVCPPKKRRMKA